MWEEQHGKAVQPKSVSTDENLLSSPHVDISDLHASTMSSSHERETVSTDDPLASLARADSNHLHASTMSQSTNSLIQPSSTSSSSCCYVPLPKKIPRLLPPVQALSSPMTLRPKRGRPVGRPPTQEILRGRRKVKNCFMNCFIFQCHHFDLIIILM